MIRRSTETKVTTARIIAVNGVAPGESAPASAITYDVEVLADDTARALLFQGVSPNNRRPVDEVNVFPAKGNCTCHIRGNTYSFEMIEVEDATGVCGG